MSAFNKRVTCQMPSPGKNISGLVDSVHPKILFNNMRSVANVVDSCIYLPKVAVENQLFSLWETSMDLRLAAVEIMIRVPTVNRCINKGVIKTSSLRLFNNETSWVSLLRSFDLFFVFGTTIVGQQNTFCKAMY